MTQARKAESMASLRSQLPDLEAIEPISQVKHAFETQDTIPRPKAARFCEI